VVEYFRVFNHVGCFRFRLIEHKPDSLGTDPVLEIAESVGEMFPDPQSGKS
jgi:hypothetical protein